MKSRKFSHPGLCQMERIPLAVGTNLPLLSWHFMMRTQCTVVLLAAPHLRCYVEDLPSTLAFSSNTNADVATPPFQNITSVPGKWVSDDEDEEGNSYGFPVNHYLKVTVFDFLQFFNFIVCNVSSLNKDIYMTRQRQENYLSKRISLSMSGLDLTERRRELWRHWRRRQ